MRPFVASLLCCILLSAGAPLLAQHAFQIVLPGLDRGVKRPAVQTPDGGFCLLGITGNMDLAGDSRMVVVKLDAAGNVEWSRKLFTSAMNDNPVALRRTPDGGFMVLAVTSVIESWDQDILVIKLNDHGYPLWSKSYTSTLVDWANDLTVLEDGSAVVVGCANAEFADSLVSPEQAAAKNGLIFRIDPQGDVLWSRILKEVQLDSSVSFIPINDSYCQGVCARENNGITVIVQIEGWPASSLLLNLDNEGRGKPSLGMMRDLIGSSNCIPFANDIAPLPDGGVLVAGVTRFTNIDSEYLPVVKLDQGFLLRIDKENRLLWHRIYQAPADNPLPLTVAPLDADHYAIAGRTLFARLFDAESAGLHFADNPMIAVTDRTGTPIEARRWITSFGDLPVPELSGSKEENAAYLWWPLFTATEDQGMLAVGLLRKPLPSYESALSNIGLSVTRFNPDLTTCGKGQTEPVELPSAPAVRSYPRDSDSPPYYADWDPVDATPYDFRRGAELIYDTAMMMPADSFEGGTGNLDEWREEAGTDGETSYEENQKETAPSDYESDYADAQEEETAIADEGNDYTDYTDESVENEADTEEVYPVEEYNTYTEGEAYADDEYGVDEYGYDEASDSSLRSEREEYPIPPVVTVQVVLNDVAVQAQVRQDVTVEDFAITPWFLCGENAMAGTASAAPEENRAAHSEFLKLLPNTVTEGKNVAAEFALHGNSKPVIELVEAASGRILRLLETKNIRWAQADGTGSASIETAGLVAGVYLVRLRCGDKQLTAKLNVQ